MPCFNNFKAYYKLLLQEVKHEKVKGQNIDHHSLTAYWDQTITVLISQGEKSVDHLVNNNFGRFFNSKLSADYFD